jgi:hypothetical protein
VPGGQGSSPICLARRPCAFAMVACDIELGRPPALIGFGRLSRSLFPSRRRRTLTRGCASGFAAASLRPSRALRRHALATALLRRINRTHAKHYEHDPFVTRPARPAFASAAIQSIATSTAPAFGRAPLLRFRPLQRSLAALALSGAAGLRTIPLRRFIPRRPARIFMRPAGVDDLLRPCGFPLGADFVAMKLAWRTFFDRSVPIESVARRPARAALNGTMPGVAAGRRSIAPTRTSSIDHAGETGETDPSDAGR